MTQSYLHLALQRLLKEGISGDVAGVGILGDHNRALLGTLARRLGATAYLLDLYACADQPDTVAPASGAARLVSKTSPTSTKAFVPDESVQFTPALDIATSKLPAKTAYCLVYIDRITTASVGSALEYFYSRLVPGGFLIMRNDSYSCVAGIERAVDNFFFDKPEFVVALPDPDARMVVRKFRSPH